MSGSRLNNYSSIDSNILEMQLTEDASFIGQHTVSLTNYKTTTIPQIAAGSKVEVSGALYGFSSAESIGGSASDGVNYIVIIPNTTTCTAEWRQTAPTWSDAKQGYYGTGGSANYRYLNFKITKVGTSYTKQVYYYDDNVVLNQADITTANILTGVIDSLTVTGDTNLSSGKKIYYDGVGHFGYDITGQVMRYKNVSVATNSSGMGYVAHGIANGKSNIIRNISGITGTVSDIARGVINSSLITFNDTNIYITGSAASTLHIFNIEYWA